MAIALSRTATSANCLSLQGPSSRSLTARPEPTQYRYNGTGPVIVTLRLTVSRSVLVSSGLRPEKCVWERPLLTTVPVCLSYTACLCRQYTFALYIPFFTLSIHIFSTLACAQQTTYKRRELPVWLSNSQLLTNGSAAWLLPSCLC
jgi:hypothetical protein